MTFVTSDGTEVTRRLVATARAALEEGGRVRRDLTLMAVLWLLVTLAAIAVSRFVIQELSFPTHGAKEAYIVDGAFMTLTYMATPVFGLVIAVVLVAVWRHRAAGHEVSSVDGAPLRGRGIIPKVWLAVTSLLAVVMIVDPGLTGLWELQHHEQPDIEINVTGAMWQWTVEYPKSGVKVAGADELVLPADRTVQVNVKSVDIVHSFWVPAFRQKIDAVPGQTHTIYVTPDQPGDPSDIAYRLQCAELCGVGHAVMAKPVRVLAPAEFEQWLASKQRAVEAR